MKPHDFIQNMLKDSEDKADALDDKGHIALYEDVTQLLLNVKDGKYHDFHRNGLDAPKIALVQTLDMMSRWVKEGRYDQ